MNSIVTMPQKVAGKARCCLALAAPERRLCGGSCLGQSATILPDQSPGEPAEQLHEHGFELFRRGYVRVLTMLLKRRLIIPV
jgi:hypothetical protein